MTASSTISSLNLSHDGLARGTLFDLLSIEIPADQAPHFIVTDVKVGKSSQLHSASCLPASLFTTRWRERPYAFDFDLVRDGERVTVSVTNVTSIPRQLVVRAVGRTLSESSPCRYDGPRLGICGLGHTIVPARSMAYVSCWSQLRYEPSVLHLPPHLSGKLSVRRVSKMAAYVLGPDGEPQPNGGRVGPHDDVPAEMLTTEALYGNGGISFKLEPAVNLNEVVVVTVENLTDDPVPVTGALLGGRLQCRGFGESPWRAKWRFEWEKTRPVG